MLRFCISDLRKEKNVSIHILFVPLPPSLPPPLCLLSPSLPNLPGLSPVSNRANPQGALWKQKKLYLQSMLTRGSLSSTLQAPKKAGVNNLPQCVFLGNGLLFSSLLWKRPTAWFLRPKGNTFVRSVLWGPGSSPQLCSIRNLVLAEALR